MTWAERVGDVAENVALLAINVLRIFTLFARVLFEALDSLVTNLAERSEGGITAGADHGRAWVSILSRVGWGVAAVILRVLSIATVFVRQVAVTLDGFLLRLENERLASAQADSAPEGSSTE